MEWQGFFTWNRLRYWVGCLLFTLFFLVIMIDPTDTILGMKSKAFVLLVAFNMVFSRPSFRFLPHIMAVYLAITIAYTLSVLQGNHPDFDSLVSTYLAFSPLILLLWAHHYNLLHLSLFPAMMVAVVVCLIFALSSYDESIEGAIYLFMSQHNKPVMMSNRYIMGIRIFGIYYKSFICVGLPLFWFYYTVYNGRSWKRWAALLPAIIMTFAFFVSGTRATMLLPFFTIALVSYKRFAAMRTGKYFLYPVLAGFFICFLLMVFVLASEKSEISNIVKYGHLISYKDLFDQHPQYLLLGQGPGTRFFSQGFHKLTETTEWTYIEIIRQYGLAGMLILFTILYPIFALWKYRRQGFILGVTGAYFACLAIAGTNPLLISSTGMQIVLVAYSVVCREETKNKLLDKSKIEHNHFR